MKHLYQLVLLCAFGIFVVGCGEQEQEDATVVEVAEPVEVVEPSLNSLKERSQRAQAEAELDPCDLLSDDVIRGQFDSAAEADISRRLSDYAVHPMCVVSWPKPNAAEIEARTAAAMSEYLERKMRGEEVKMPSLATQDEVTLTLFQPQFEDNARAIASFDQAMSVLQRGVKSRAGDTQVSFQTDVTPVDGVGDKATWSGGMRQVSVVQGTRIYYITVNTGSEPGVEEALALALAKGVGEML
jgi:hypothetical protein